MQPKIIASNEPKEVGEKMRVHSGATSELSELEVLRDDYKHIYLVKIHKTPFGNIAEIAEDVS